ncbi:MAG: ice-binding family protein, partial [Bacteroidota bacterium]|nr:ice-binding family protein [Bacteroidota bacterium]
MTTSLLTQVLTCFFLLSSFSLIAQAPSLGAAQDFAVFTAVGAFSNDGASVVTGDIGTNAGSFTGFPPGVVVGDIHIADLVSAQAAADVNLAYNFLSSLTCNIVLGVGLGNNQVLTPNTYCTGAATTLTGMLTFDAEGDPDAIFIIQIDGAFSSSTLSSVTLINGASLCNIYWQINGAVELGVNSVFLGTILANGAISLLEGASLQGRALTRAGAIDMHNNIVSIGLPAIAPVIMANGPTTFCPGGSVTISGNIDGVFSNGSTGPSITVTSSGDYYVVNTTLCGTDTSNHIIVVVIDETPPDIVCPANLTIECDEDSSPLATGTATSTDNCDANPDITFNDFTNTSTQCDQNATISRTWTATDASGNTVSCVQTITIEDSTSPVITCATPTSPVECNTIPVFPVPTVTDACDDEVVLSFIENTIPGACGQEYTLIRTWTAT